MSETDRATGGTDDRPTDATDDRPTDGTDDRTTDATDDRTTDATDDRPTDATDDETGDGFWDVGVVTTLVVVGLGLVVFPEPATTIVGVLLLATGVSLGVLDLVT